MHTDTGARVFGAGAGNTTAQARRRGVGDIVLALLCVLLPTLGHAQTDPRTLPLVQAGDVVYLGSIYSPLGGQHGMAVDGSTWYFGCLRGVAVLELPALGGTAKQIGACAAIPNSSGIHPTDTDFHVGGILSWAGRLIVTAWTYYDAGWGMRAGHYAGAGATSLSGPFPMQTPFTSPAAGRQRMVAGYLGVIPQEWRGLLGGPALSGQSNVPIISNSSRGPSVSVFDPADVGAKTPVPATMLIGYPEEHQTLGRYEDDPPKPFYGGTDQLGAVAFPAGTRSVLFTGRHGESNCYGVGTPDRTKHRTPHPDGNGKLWCYNSQETYQGAHGEPYQPSMWAYDANDLLAVKQGTRKHWEILPYARWRLPHFPDANGEPNLMRSGTYDPATKRLYVGRTDSNEVKVYEIRIGAPPPPPVPVDCVGTWSAWARVAGSETACVSSRRDYKESRAFTVTTAASNGGKACPASPETRTASEDCAGDPPPPPPTPAIRLECSHITTITRGQDYVGGDQRWTVRGTCRELNAVGAVVGPPKE